MSDEIDELRRAVERAQEREQTIRGGGDQEEWNAALADVLAAERALSLALEEETAVACDWPEPWDIGAPNVHVLASSWKVFLLYEPSGDVGATVVVELVRCSAHRLGAPNDEVLHGHPLHGRGLEPYRAHLIANSRWIADLMRINSVHDLYKPDAWSRARHYLLVFKEAIFECIAHDHRIERVDVTMHDAVAMIASRLRD
ncbi:MAG: hypothetical protein ACXVDD_01185 [Polyangia bacterium]